MDLRQFFLTENECYKVGAKMNPKGFMLHSTGANNPNISRYVPLEVTKSNHWNVYRPSGRQVCVHGFIGKLENGNIATVQTLPWTMRGWHGGGSSNNSYIGVEICEDGLEDATYFNKVYNEAVELVAMLAKQFNWEINSNTVLCHSEGYKKGIASNHADVLHWFPKHGKSMDTFRADVKTKMNKVAPTEPKQESTTTNYLVKINTDELNVRDGAGTDYKVNAVVKRGEVFTIVEEKINDTTKWGKLKSNAGWISLGYTVPYTATTKKAVNEVAKEVIAGKWGNGADRKKRLTDAGYNYNEVQKEVNKLLK